MRIKIFNPALREKKILLAELTPPSMHYVYVLKTKNRKLYIGYTDDLRRRLKEHQKEKPYQLIYYEAYLLDKDARERERKLKYYGSAWRAIKKRISA